MADNLAAIAAHIESLRAQLRWGVVDARGAFAGFAALPPPGEDWRQVLGYMPDERPTAEELEQRYLRLRSIQHPDKGGSASQFDRVQRAYAAAREEL